MFEFERISGHEQVVFCHDPKTNLKAIIAIHNTTLGPALGGCRMRPYNTVDEALEDVLRLSKGMTYKCAASDVDFGGGKSVIIGDPLTDKSPELFRAFGQFVESLGGRFYTGTDMGTMPDDFVHALQESSHIVGVPEAYGGHGDSSIPTAQGVLYGLEATSQELWGDRRLGERRYAIQGLGKVGYKVARRLLEEGATLYVSDIDYARIQDLEAEAELLKGAVIPLTGEDIYSADADVFIPCALGAIIHDRTLDQLRVKAVVGSANNQLAEDRHGTALKELGVLYAPDYIVNAGGLIQVADELHPYPNKERVIQKTRAIYETLTQIFKEARASHLSTTEAANRFCETRLSSRAARSTFFLPNRAPKWQIRH